MTVAVKESVRSRGISFHIIGLFVLILVWDTSAQLLLKLGLSSHGEFPLHHIDAAMNYLGAIVTEPMIWLSAVALVLAFLTWLAIIARVDLSKAHPATSFSYITVTVASAIFLQETVNVMKMGGILLIMLGVFLVSKSD